MFEKYIEIYENMAFKLDHNKIMIFKKPLTIVYKRNYHMDWQLEGIDKFLYKIPEFDNLYSIAPSEMHILWYAIEDMKMEYDFYDSQDKILEYIEFKRI